MANQLEQLKAMTVVSADTADLDAFAELQPHDATTNPTFIAAIAPDPKYAHLVNEAVTYAKTHAKTQEEALELALDRLCVNVGLEIAKRVPGFVSTEVDARLSFDASKTVARARRLVAMYEAEGVTRARVLVKIAGTYEGIQAAKQLETEGIKTNITLVFSFAQAVLAAEAGATLISPFVGRMMDWHKKASGVASYSGEQDPGVVSVSSIYAYYKRHGYNTIVMGASFRNLDEIYALAGVDRLTIAPKFLEALKNSSDPLPRKLDPESRAVLGADKTAPLDEAAFRWMLNEDACGTEKLAEGIRAFGADTVKVEKHLQGLAAWSQ